MPSTAATRSPAQQTMGTEFEVAARNRIQTLTDFCFHHRRLTIVGAVLALVALWALASTLGGQFHQALVLPGTESQATADRLEQAGFERVGGYSGTAVVHRASGLESGDREAVATLVERVEATVEGVAAHDPFGSFGGQLVSEDATTAVIQLDFAHGGLDEALAAAEQIRMIGAGHDVPGLEFGGDLFVEEPDFAATGVGLMAAAVILLLAFGSLIAMGLPLVTALLGIGGGVAVVQLATRWMDIAPFTPGAVAMIGIGAGINYALFIVTRYREELAHRDPAAAARHAMDTAGRAALFAGSTVITSLLGLLVIGIADVRALALAIAAGVLFVLLATITVLPALLGTVGDRIDRFGLPWRARTATADVERSVWYRWSRTVQRRPLPAAIAALAVLSLLAIPTLDLRLGVADASVRPVHDTTRRAHDLIADALGEGWNGPIVVAVAVPDGAITTVAQRLERLENRADITEVLPPVPNETGDTAFVQVVPASSPQHQATAALVRDLRGGALDDVLEGTGADALVGGVTAGGIDFAEVNERYLPWFIAVVLLAAFLLLVVSFRSLLVPLKAVGVNMLTVGAAYGVVVAVFQWGWFGGLLGLGQPGPIEPWVPMMLFAIVFGLSIDYEVFLLSRIREHHRATGDSSTAVADGLARCARLIFAAAAIMVFVFAGFALLAQRELQILGLGLAVSIAVDATLVRLVVVPSLMELAGERNWWLPGWLDRLLPGDSPPVAAASTPAREPVRTR
jgi:putative drug exporter of the RND superfamily